MDAVIKQLVDQVIAANSTGSSLAIRGQGSKCFYGNEEQGEPLLTSGVTGIVDYDPSELVITARAGTTLSELQAALDEQHQMLAFEPLMIGGGGTVGGMVATGLSGSRRPWSGGVRDYVLGLHVINGLGEYCRFGGQVMKNVAGYDVARLMVGAMGCLGVLTQVSLKVLPKPQVARTAVVNMPMKPFIEQVSSWKSKMNPITGVVHDGKNGFLRLEGFGQHVDDFARQKALVLTDDLSVWSSLQNQTHAFFTTGQPLWRVSLPQWTLLDASDLKCLMDWAGGQYWVSGATRDELKQRVDSRNGHVHAFRNTDAVAFEEPSPMLLKLHQQLKAAYDPRNIFNPGRLFPGV